MGVKNHKQLPFIVLTKQNLVRERKLTAWLMPILTPLMAVADDQRCRADGFWLLWASLHRDTSRREEDARKVVAILGLVWKEREHGSEEDTTLPVKPIGCTAGD